MNTYDADTKRRFDELIPWYITGQLKDVDRAWIEKMASEHSALSAELEWHRNLQREIHAKYASVRTDVGLDSLLARVREGRQPVKPKGLAARLRGFLAPLAARPAYAFGAVVVVVQAGIIGALLTQAGTEAEFSPSRSIAPLPAANEAPVLQVTFKADATQRNMNLLLVRVGGNVVAGPSQIGEYIIEVPKSRIELAKKELEGSGLVEVVTVLERRPTTQ